MLNSPFNFRRRLGLLVIFAHFASAAAFANFHWESLPMLPASAGQVRQPGLASPFAGVHGEVLLVGGGANFPDQPPWAGGAKNWWDDLFVLERSQGGEVRWLTEQVYKLPRPLAYGWSFSTSDGVICVGGSDATQCYRDVFRLTRNPRNRRMFWVERKGAGMV